MPRYVIIRALSSTRGVLKTNREGPCSRSRRSWFARCHFHMIVHCNNFPSVVFTDRCNCCSLIHFARDNVREDELLGTRLLRYGADLLETRVAPDGAMTRSLRDLPTEMYSRLLRLGLTSPRKKPYPEPGAISATVRDRPTRRQSRHQTRMAGPCACPRSPRPA